jgi:hypothetical protein
MHCFGCDLVLFLTFCYGIYQIFRSRDKSIFTLTYLWFTFCNYSLMASGVLSVHPLSVYLHGIAHLDMSDHLRQLGLLLYIICPDYKDKRGNLWYQKEYTVVVEKKHIMSCSFNFFFGGGIVGGLKSGPCQSALSLERWLRLLLLFSLFFW